jgi:hypothetical protein
MDPPHDGQVCLSPSLLRAMVYVTGMDPVTRGGRPLGGGERLRNDEHLGGGGLSALGC